MDSSPPDELPRNWTVRIEGTGWSHNAERRMHWADHGRRTAQWRKDAAWAVKAAKVPHLDAVTVEIIQESRTANLGDPAACAPWAKACIDGGLVDAGVVDDDDGEHVGWIRFWPPRKTGRDAIVLRICEYSSIGT